ncbi:MAG: RidA family protein [Leptolyngbyaceae cyanobacterium SL_1_1]|nr:RidA family protein [Leptolyngbyaceae cyanobacterium RM2_2_21]NJN04633.1 RidA family protein [Leptolyngbyaceae cyanobacterium RM1_1_2]NJO09191.1 RidA family protein [Leptolyngbyaceae cyanobacterium SL_1_1]
MINFITLSNQLPPVAPYSHAVKAGDFLFVTGQLAEDPATGEIIKGSIEAQTHLVMENLKLVLAEAGISFGQVVMARIFLTDFRYYEAVNQIYTSYFTTGRFPGRTTIGVMGLAGIGDIEIDLIAYCGS